MGFSIGIDLGTTNTLVSTGRKGVNGNIEIITERISQIGEDGFTPVSEELLPSFLYVENGEQNVGLKAKAMKSQNKNRVISNSKNFIGENNYKWNIDNKDYTPESVAAYILSAIRIQLREKYGDENDLKDAVITVPASFNIDQRNATKRAAQLAGFDDEITLISEPTAAILDFINEQSKLDDKYKDVDFSEFKNVLVFDLGGGTCDVAILNVEIKGENIYVEELAVSPHTLIGGFNFDVYAAEGVLKDCCRDNNINIEDELSEQDIEDLKSKLIVLLEKAKIILSGRYEMCKSTEDKLEYVDKKPYPIQIPNAINGKAFKVDLTMKRYNEYIQPLLSEEKGSKSIINSIIKTLEAADLSVDNIDYVFCVGGMTKYPLVKNKIKELLGKEPLNLLDSMNSVSRGAAVYEFFNLKEGTNTGERKSTKNNKVSIVPTLPQSIFLNVKSGLPIPLIKAKTKAGTPIILDKLIKVTSEIGVELDLYSGMSPYDPELKRLNKIRLDFPHGIKVGTDISLKLEYTSKGILKFEAWVSDNEDIRVEVQLEGNKIEQDQIEKMREDYQIEKVGGIF